MDRRAALVSTILLVLSALGPAVSGGPVGDAAAAGSSIQIVSMDMPGEMEPGQEYDTMVTFRNTGEDAAQVRVAYIFDGSRVISMNEVVAAGETKEVGIRISLSDAANSRPGKLYDGTYEHGYRIGNAQAQQDVTVSGLGTPTPTATPIEQETVGGDSDGDGPGAGDLAILKSDLPSSLAFDEQATAAIQIENRGSETRKIDVVYVLNGRPTVGSPATIGAGERETVTFPVSGRDLQEAYGGTLEEGTYDWHVEAGNARVSGQIALGSGGSGGSGEASTGDAGFDQSVDGETRPRRGFFSNGEPRFGFLDSFSLTVGGFILSALGIFHQMLNG